MWRGALAACLAFALALLFVPAAHAADRIYWSNLDGASISWANLNGDGTGGTLNTTGATVKGPMGLTIDPSRGLLYWTNWNWDGGHVISYAHLDGSGGGDLTVTGATVSGPHGLAIDPSIGTAGRLYWPNYADNSISWADLNGTGGAAGGDFAISDATVDGPRGMMIDPVDDRLYWSNFAEGVGMNISYVSLAGPGDGDLIDVGPLGEGPEGTAIDPASRKMYWSDYGQKHLIQYANLDGTGVSTLNTKGAETQAVHGVAIDTDTHRIYWANYDSGSISWAALDGSGGQNLNTSGSTLHGPNLPAILKSPASKSAPNVTGGADPGTTLSCSPGQWAGDVLEALEYRAPQSLAYAWTVNGTKVPGNSNSITAGADGKYRCEVTATNAAGSTTATSAPHQVGQPPSNDFSFGAVKLDRTHGTAKAAVEVPGPGTVTLAGRDIAVVEKHPTAAGEALLAVKPLGDAKRTLKHQGKVTVHPRVTFTPTDGDARTKGEKITLHEKR